MMKYKDLRGERTQEAAAAKTGISVSSARRGRDWVGDKVKQYGGVMRGDFGAHVRGKRFGLE